VLAREDNIHISLGIFSGNGKILAFPGDQDQSRKLPFGRRKKFCPLSLGASFYDKNCRESKLLIDGGIARSQIR
jgi:hypothetical protein